MLEIAATMHAATDARWTEVEEVCTQHAADYLSFLDSKVSEEGSPQLTQKVEPVYKSEYGFAVVDERATAQKLRERQLKERTAAAERHRQWSARLQSVTRREERFKKSVKRLRSELTSIECPPRIVFRTEHWDALCQERGWYQLNITKGGKLAVPATADEVRRELNVRSFSRAYDGLFPQGKSVAHYKSPLFGQGQWYPGREFGNATELYVRLAQPTDEALSFTRGLSRLDGKTVDFELRFVCSSDQMSLAFEEQKLRNPSGGSPLLQMRCENAVGVYIFDEAFSFDMPWVLSALDRCDARSLD